MKKSKSYLNCLNMNVLSLQPSIDLIIGPMFSGKSTELIRRLVIYHEMKMNTLYINSEKDNRSEKSFSTHNKTIGTLPFDTIKIDSLESVDVTNYKIIGIDEGQLFQNLKKVVLDWVENQDKIVVISGLNGDFLRRSFGEINDLVPYCDGITKLCPFCISCREKHNTITFAQFTKRTNSNQSTILIGDKDAYIPVCRKCFNS